MRYASCKVRDQLPGTVKFLFQPAQESPPPGEDGGAALMVKQGANVTFFVEDSAMKLGVRALLNLAVDYMESSQAR